MDDIESIIKYDTIKLKNIKLGKEQKFNNTLLIPIYYNNNNNSNNSKNKYNTFKIKTPRLFISKIYKNKYSNSLEITFPNIRNSKKRKKSKSQNNSNNSNNKNNQIEDDSYLFYKKLIKVESSIKKKIIGRNKYALQDKQYSSLFKHNTIYDSEKTYIPFTYKSTQLIDINKNKIDESSNKILTPTYGYLIIQVKNVWIKDNQWGLNLFCNGGMILPSQYLDPPPIPQNHIELFSFFFHSKFSNFQIFYLLMLKDYYLQEVF